MIVEIIPIYTVVEKQEASSKETQKGSSQNKTRRSSKMSRSMTGKRIGMMAAHGVNKIIMKGRYELR